MTTERALRILAADEDRDALRETAQLLERLGHEVTSYAIAVDEALERIAVDEPDLAVVVLHSDQEHALELIDEMSEYAAGPVVVIAVGEAPGFLEAAAERGVYAYARGASGDEVQAAISLAMRRFAERRRLTEQVDQLEGALARRAVIERAKGILMERHGVDERQAFARLREHARSHNRTVVATAQAVAEGHALLPRGSQWRVS